MVRRDEGELAGFQANANEFHKCSNCGKLLSTRKEEKVKLCKDCQERRHNQDINNSI
ncbi:hypothetical protein SAMN05216243_2158 [Sediminibacillus albus]|uniref:Uncharacterized protein n=1 Tax=Sediminibacillus albus TaxID=407036 RepID=A0A1G8ZQ81_9BACI|nr:hypothetical protein SAMN05216243_2158 [Sediminibacillus albus]